MHTKRSLTSVHEALNNAAFEAHDGRDDVIAFRIDKRLKEQTARICESNSATLSEFLRQCCLGLVNDYCDPARG